MSGPAIARHLQDLGLAKTACGEIVQALGREVTRGVLGEPDIQGQCLVGEPLDVCACGSFLGVRAMAVDHRVHGALPQLLDAR